MRNVPTELVLLQLAEGLQALVKNPDISNIIKESYALSEEESKKYSDAMDIIKTADNIYADIKAKQEALTSIEERIAEAEKLEAFNEDTLKEIKRRENEIVAQAKKNDSDANDNKEFAKFLDERQDALIAKEAELKVLAAEVEKGKKDLKKRLDAIKDGL